MMQGFKKFILRGNVVDLAVGVMVGAAFNNIVNSLVKDLFTPFIGAIFKLPDFSGAYFVLNGSHLIYGNFINAIISFLIVATAIYFFIITPINVLIKKNKKNEIKHKKCLECLSEIPIKANRCAFCTSKLN